MSSFTPSDISHAHFIGIGGIGMSALARAYLHEGVMVSGSDRSPSPITATLAREGAVVFEGHAAENVVDGVDIVIYTEAVNERTEGFVELHAAREKGIRTINYFEALGALVNPYYLIAVAGAHGKTTTTAMLIDIFEDAGLDPTAVVGSLRAKTKSNFRAGKSKYAIVEACEYKRDFLYLEPDVLVITNIDYEHTDYYRDLADVQSAFRELALKVPETGFVVVDTAAPNLAPVLDGLRAEIIDYRTFFDPLMKLRAPGLHNRLNAAAALAAASTQDIDLARAKESLSAFLGTWRRFEYKGVINGAPLYDDYSHHPKEIEAAISGARERYPDKKIIVVFQPHTYSRTEELFTDFVDALAKADQVIVLPIYAAREENVYGVSSEKLVSVLIEGGAAAEGVAGLPLAAERVKELATPETVVVVMGAGDVTGVAQLLSVV